MLSCTMIVYSTPSSLPALQINDIHGGVSYTVFYLFILTVKIRGESRI